LIVQGSYRCRVEINYVPTHIRRMLEDVVFFDLLLVYSLLFLTKSRANQLIRCTPLQIYLLPSPPAHHTRTLRNQRFNIHKHNYSFSNAPSCSAVTPALVPQRDNIITERVMKPILLTTLILLYLQMLHVMPTKEGEYRGLVEEHTPLLGETNTRRDIPNYTRDHIGESSAVNSAITSDPPPSYRETMRYDSR